MKDSPPPFVSVVTVNFNGIFFLKTLFDSISSLDYPQEKLQVIMVDNCSSDGSVSYVKNNYPFVEILEINKNLGFAGGNNEGAKAAKGDYIAFINNDCAVEKDWLSSLTYALKEKEAQNIKVGGAGSKVLFYFKYLTLKISFEDIIREDLRNESANEFHALIKDLKINTGSDEFSQNDSDGRDDYKQILYAFANKSFKYSSGFSDFGRDDDRNIIRKVRNNAIVRVPVADMGTDMEIELMVSFVKPGANLKVSVENDNSGETLGFSFFDAKGRSRQCDVKNTSAGFLGEAKSSMSEYTDRLKNIAAEDSGGKENTRVQDHFELESDEADDSGSVKSFKENKSFADEDTDTDKITRDAQNSTNFVKTVIKIPAEKYSLCQNIVNSCGSMINKSFYAREINYECVDDGTLQQSFEVFALPGSSFILNKKLVMETGLFDEKFFTYYEDIDLFWRSALKGWKFFAVPGSVARHFHCGSGEEWSRSFTYHVLRNRLLMIYRCCWFSGFLKNYLSFCASALINLLYLAAAKAKGRKLDRPDILIRIKIFFEFFIIMVLHFGKRFKIRTSSSMTDKSIKGWQQDF